MTALRCTAKLLKRLGMSTPGEPSPPENALGDWYANIIFTRVGHYVLLVSERSRLPVLLTARDLHSLPTRFIQTLADLLADLDVPTHQIDREIGAMQPLFFGKTANRSVLGTLNDNVFLAKHYLASGELSVVDVTRVLARAPCLPLESIFPIDETRRLLANPRGFTVLQGRERTDPRGSRQHHGP
jgi:hypothetical protein